MSTFPIRPGILVSLKTSIPGGREYHKTDYETRVDARGREVADWRTTRTVEDPEEYERAQKARDEATGLIKQRCNWTPFGLIAPASDESALNEAIREAQDRISAFNAEARTCRVRVSVLKGRIADSDAEAIRAVRNELADLLIDLEDATQRGDVKTIRDLASRSLQVNKLLDESPAKDKVAGAVKTARKVARDIVRLVEKRGDQLEDVLGQQDLSPVASARFLFAASEESSVDDSGVEVGGSAAFAGIGAVNGSDEDGGDTADVA